MNIAMISTPNEATPPAGYGGTERVVSMLTERIVSLGHNVTLFATGDSKTKASLVSYYKSAVRPYQDVKQLIHAAKTFNELETGGFDIIHNNVEYGGAFASFSDIPVITTLHNVSPVYEAFPNGNYVAISNNQMKAVQSNGMNVISRIYNGINTDEFPFSETGGNYLAFLGRLGYSKGAHMAIKVAKRLGLKLKIAGNISNPEFFEHEIAPHLDNQYIEYIGELNDAQKSDFLKNSLAILFPVQWDEPFGLVMVEAMACGTPVIGFNRGAVPEVLQDGVTGFVVNDVDEMVKGVLKIDTLDRAKCRKHVEENFHVNKMVRAYTELYESFL